VWLITTFGFFSIVQKPGDDILVVRARTRQDLDRLKIKYIPELGEIIQGTDEDYKYVADGPRDAVARAVGEIAMTIDYRDLRESVLTLQGYRRAMLYERIWNILWKLQVEEQWFDI